MQPLHNIHKGDKCFIIGTGPSLQSVPTDRLNTLSTQYTFGVNYLMRYTLIQFVPTFYCVDEWPDLQSVDELLRLRCPEIRTYHHSLPGVFPERFYSHSWKLNDAPPGWVYVQGDDTLDMQQGAFSGLGDTLEPTASHGGSVVMFTLQLACWMGFDPIYLLGCDATREGHAYKEPLIRQRNRQDIFQAAALNAYRAMQAAGRSLIDLTEGGLLPVPKGRIQNIL